MRILFVSHSHPGLTKGGAEMAAHDLYTEMGKTHETWFLGCTRDPNAMRTGAPFSQPFGEREYIYACGEFDWFHFANRDPRFPAAFRALLQDLRPDVVHFHHYLNIGVEALLIARDTLPEARIILTLHEYLALCNHHGQLVTTEHYTLCSQASPRRCNRCFPDQSTSDFTLREMYIKRFFDVVDHFVSPSAFLAERYCQWGIARAKMSVIENPCLPMSTGTASVAPRAPAGTTGIEPRALRAGFFGQISRLKGINVVFDAARILDQSSDADIVFEIHGDYSGQPKAFQDDFISRLATAGTNVRYRGPYDREQLARLMQTVDVALVPSIWWENSPLVIQEARQQGLPVICSDIGGMKEKVRPEIDGWHFPAGDAVSLAGVLKDLSARREKLHAIGRGKRHPSGNRATRDLLGLHEQLMSSRT